MYVVVIIRALEEVGARSAQPEKRTKNIPRRTRNGHNKKSSTTVKVLGLYCTKLFL